MDIPTRDDSRAVPPELKLVRAALDLLIKDGMDYLTKCDSKPVKPPPLWFDQRRAFNDLCKCGHMTKRLADLNDLDAVYISERFRAYVRRYYAALDSQSE
ncbi:hypothetical protein [Aliidiomarina indica]|uniref:hypothetical protein n=1 Tax=Aliidiomarina indica TaxID=2749147 RepID=UPI00188ECBC3|nr:hypothetical protein [Aliidiomarina indica]